MALLGREGILELRRELTPPVIIPPSQISIANNRFTIDSDNFWTGDAVKLYGDGTSVVTVLTGFFSKDPLGNASIYTTQDGALNRSSSQIVSLGGLSSTRLMIAHDTSSTHALFLTDYFRRFLFDSSISVSTEFSLSEDIDNYNSYKQVGPPYLSWKTQATIRSWQLSTQTPDIDITSIGERYRESIKSVLSGSGTFDFLVDIYAEPGLDDSTALLRLALMLEYGAKGNARFYLSPDVDETSPRRTSKALPSSHKKLYYSSKIILTNATIDTSGEGLVVGSADFVTTGPIKLGVDVEKDGTYAYDSTGTELGVFTYYSGHSGNYSDDYGVNATISENGDYYVSNGARTNSIQGTTPPLGCSLVKFGRSNLNWPNWSKIYTVNDDFTYEAFGHIPQIDKQGNLWVCFYKKNATTLRYKVCLAKIDKTDGSVINSFCVTFPLTSESLSVPAVTDYDFDNDGNVYIGTNWRDSNNLHHPCIIKVFADGVIGWVRRLGKSSGNRGAQELIKLKVINNEIFIGCKNTRGDTITGTYARGASFVKLNLDGSTKASPRMFRAQTDLTSSTQNDARILACDIAPDGSVYAIYIPGDTVNSNGNNQIYVLKANPNLSAAWCYALNHGPNSVETGTNALWPRDVHVDNQGRVFILGRSIHVSLSQLRPCKTWDWNSQSYNWGAGISELDSGGNYLSIRYYNTSSVHRNNFNEYSLYSIDNSVRFAKTAGNTSNDFLPLATKGQTSRGGSSAPRTQLHVLAKKDGQFGTWGVACEDSAIGDLGLTVFGYTPFRSSSLAITETVPSTTILADNFSVESDSSYVVAADFALTTPVNGFSVGD